MMRTRKSLRKNFSKMPPHPDVPGGLRKLRDAGFPAVHLSRTICLKFKAVSSSMVALSIFFERRFSVDGVKAVIKPSRQAYAYVERELGVAPSQLCLNRLSCMGHAWGPWAAGWEAALIKRVGNDVLGVGPQPQIVGDDLDDVAAQLIARPQRAGADSAGDVP